MAKNLANFLPLPRKLNNPNCHNPRKCDCPPNDHKSIEDYLKCSNGFKCNICLKRYKSKDELTQHYYDTPDHPKQCKWCSNICTSNEKLIMHYVEVHIGSGESKHQKNKQKNLNCPILNCNEGFNGNGMGFKNHLNSEHGVDISNAIIFKHKELLNGRILESNTIFCKKTKVGFVIELVIDSSLENIFYMRMTSLSYSGM